MPIYRNFFKPSKRQKGVYVVEFAIIGSVFLVAMFLVMEFARLLFVYNVLDEIARRGARLASVCHFSQLASFNTTSRLDGIVLNINSAELVVEYLDEDGVSITDDLSVLANFNKIRYVRARIQGYQHQGLFPMALTFNAPNFQTTLPAESLGINPDGTGDPTC